MRPGAGFGLIYARVALANRRSSPFV